MIKYTFLLPAYKSKFFAEALRSIKGQTLRDFKVIVSDDCSPEDIKSIYDREAGGDSRFTYRRNAENMGRTLQSLSYRQGKFLLSPLKSIKVIYQFTSVS